jgi:hypothetical protein
MRSEDCLPDWLGAQHVALAPLRQVDAGQREAVGGGRHGVQPRARRAARLAVGHQQAETRSAATPDPAAQLVQLADAEAVGVQHHHHGRVRHVDADLDDGRRHEHVQLAAGEALHDGVLGLRRHPAVQHLDPQPRQRTGHQQLVRVQDRHTGPAPVGRRLVRVVTPDPRADDEGLVALGDLIPDALPGGVQPGRLLGGRHDRAADR